MTQHLGIPFAAQPDFLAAAQSLLPPGDAWPRDAAAEMTLLLDAFMASQTRVHSRIADLTETEAVPFLSTELLPAWEAVYGLPDPCTPLNATILQRQAAVKARMASNGGQTEAYFIGVAAALGYTITITTFTPVKYGVSTYGSPFYDDTWRFRWQVNVPNIAQFPAQYGESQYGETYVAFLNTQLSCVLNRIKPAYSTLIMNYGS